ncbi:iron ABC transporter permease [Hujiaoplasma nucleasis]|uniref:Iron ABC transporter permease n=1 Tax=Hujiaoplasma nucleasis TaxID=2725268 RepID=A0A7L6N5M1_9MOLU|nr:iron ABC transporter permease [Hujiaoplasma nucleasis]QLY39869.1 iron ABC transporter permease [Hujiaoplasma nucleasis]
MNNKSFIFKMTMMFIVFFLSILVAMKVGAASSSWDSVFNALFAKDKSNIGLILFEIRIPRVLAALLVGSALGLAGSMMQGMTRNPLADPGLLGISAGAMLMITLGQIFFRALDFIGFMILAFIGSLIGVVIVLSLSFVSRKKLTTMTLLLAGSAISAMLFALSQGFGLLFNVSKDVSMWTSGGLMAMTYSQVLLALPLVIIALIASLFMAKDITAISLNEEVAIGLGLKIQRTKTIGYFLIALLTGVSVALAGALTFVGLMIPHLARMLVGYDYKKIIPASFLIGGIFIVLSDSLARTINAPYETPLIAIVSVIGLPFFFWVIKQKTGGEL